MSTLTQPLTEHERKAFERVQDLLALPSRENTGPCVVRSTLDGHPVAVIAFVSVDPGVEPIADIYNIEPLAIIVDEHLMSRLADPTRRVNTR